MKTTKQVQAALIKALQNMKVIDLMHIGGQWVDVEVPVPFHIMESGWPLIDCEQGVYVGDYYSEFGSTYHKDIETLAEKHGCFCEWVNAGGYGIYK